MNLPSVETMSIIGSCLVALFTFLTSLGGGCYWLFSTILKWTAEKINPVIADHRKMVQTATEAMPEVTKTLCALKETQIQQCKAQERHDEKLDLVLAEIRKSNAKIEVPPK